MSGREHLIDEIIQAEWQMFQSVENVGGRAPCQDEQQTFRIMRESQIVGWSDETLESYFEDLKKAKNAGRNLLTEKYARMMKSTSPLDYSQIESMLPQLDAQLMDLINQIAAVTLDWQRELAQKFPHVLAKGRPIFSTQDSSVSTSLETYLRGELATYSMKTLKLLLANIEKQKAAGINGSAITMTHMVKSYGFNSLEEANEKLKPQTLVTGRTLDTKKPTGL